jgi:hypothetical protein
MRKLLVVLVVLALLAVVGDRLAAKVATNEAEKRLRTEGLADPSVGVGGFPFLTQVLRRNFDKVTVSTPSISRDGVRADRVSATATHVDVPRGGDVLVGGLTARGTISYAEVLRQVGREGLQLHRASADEVRLRRSVSVLGQTLAVSARGRVEAHGRRITVVPRGFEVQGGQAISPPVAAALTDRFTFTYVVRGLPSGLRIARITPGAQGFVVTLTGRDVRLDGVAAALG